MNSWARRSMAAIIGTASLAAALGTGQPTTATPARNDADLVVTAPSTGEVGRAAEIDLRLSGGGRPVSALEATLRFDEAAAEFGGLFPGGEDAPVVGVESVIVDQAPGGVAFMLYRCTVPGCRAAGEEQEARRQIGEIRIRIVPLAPGPLTVSLEDARFVDRAGHPLDVAVHGASFVIDVSGDPEPDLEPVSTDVATGSDAGAGQAPGPDVTGDGTITAADSATLGTAWGDARSGGLTCGDAVLDANGDGCLDVADVQLAAAAEVPPAPTGIRAITSGKAPRHGAAQPTRAPSIAAVAATFVVNTVEDRSDSRIGNAVCATSVGTCSLRAAIQEANAVGGPNTIAFNIAGTGPHTIQLASALPTINDDSGGLRIDGYTQAGAAPNTALLASNATIKIGIRGNGTAHHGFTIVSPGNVLRGLAIYNLVDHIRINTSNGHSNSIVGNFIGTDPGATFRSVASGTTGHGIHLENSAHDNVIGSAALPDRNVISGAPSIGVRIDHENSDRNKIQNNIFGLRPSGTANLANGRTGIDVQWGPSGNLIGGLGASERNVISGHSYTGVDLSHSTSTSQNEVAGNFIGTTLDGGSVSSFTRTGYGIIFKDDIANNKIHHNVVGGAQNHALWHKHVYTGRNYIYDNRIGLSLTGTPLPNIRYGMYLVGHDWVVGPGNIFANNASGGIYVDLADSDRNRLTENVFLGNGGLAIDLAPAGPTANDTGDGDSGPNEGLNHPVLATVSTAEARGTTCPGCRVEVYRAAVDAGSRGEGGLVVGTGVADAQGAFRVDTSGLKAGDQAAAITIDPAGNTSEFSPVVLVTSDTSPPPPANLLANGDFELDVNGNRRPDSWTFSSYFSTSTASVKSGQFAGRHRATDNASYTVQASTSELQPGRSYLVAGWVSIPATSDALSITVQIRWRSASGVVATTTAGSFTAATNSWQPFSVTLTAPAGTAAADVVMSVKSLNGVIDVDNFSVTSAS